MHASAAAVPRWPGREGGHQDISSPRLWPFYASRGGGEATWLQGSAPAGAGERLTGSRPAPVRAALYGGRAGAPVWPPAREGPPKHLAHSRRLRSRGGHEATETGLAYAPVSQAHGHNHIVQVPRGGGGGRDAESRHAPAAAAPRLPGRRVGLRAPRILRPSPVYVRRDGGTAAHVPPSAADCGAPRALHALPGGLSCRPAGRGGLSPGGSKCTRWGTGASRLGGGYSCGAPAGGGARSGSGPPAGWGLGLRPSAAATETRPAGLPGVRLPLPVALGWVIRSAGHTNASLL